MSTDGAAVHDRVSVVIPCYNQARFLAEAIESVRAQTPPCAEIVVVDDGSTDDTVAVARRYESVRCVSQRNQGQGAARNTGLEQITAGHVVFLDSDDRLLPHAFDAGLRCFAAHPDIAFVAGRCVAIGPDGVQRRTRQDPVVERHHYLRLLASNYIWMPGTVMFRTDVVRRLGGFRTTVSGAEDYDLYLRIARHHRIWCHDRVVAEYRQHESSTSRRPMQMMRATLSVLYAQQREVKGDRLAERAMREGIEHWRAMYGEQLMNDVRKQLRAGDWRRALPSLIGLLQYHPAGFLHHARRKISRVARGCKPEGADAIG